MTHLEVKMLKQDILRTYNLLSGNKIKKLIGCYRSPGVHAVITLRFGQWLLKQNPESVAQ
jgi:serine O-acetyltransferase